MNKPPRDEPSAKASGDDALLAVLREDVLKPLAESRAGMDEIGALLESSFAKLCGAAGSAAAVVRVLAQSDLGIADTHGLYYAVHRCLLRVLVAVDARSSTLLDVAENSELPWYVRRDALLSLGGEGDDDAERRIIELVADTTATGEIRDAALRRLVDWNVERALPVLRSLGDDRARGRRWFGAEESLLRARGALGDATALRPLIVLSQAAFATDRELGQAGLDDLVVRLGGRGKAAAMLLEGKGGVGVAADLEALARSDPDPEVRRWALDRLSAEAPAAALDVCVAGLGDRAWLVRSGASDRLVELAGSARQLISAAAANIGAPLQQRLWAIYTLLRLGKGAAGALGDLTDWRAPWPPPLPEAVRETVIRAWAPYGEPGTDVRWSIEAKLAPPGEPELTPELADALKAALAEAGWPDAERVDYADHMGQGDATFSVVDLGETMLHVSDFGPFAAVPADAPPLAPATYRRLLNAMDKTGFIVLDEAQLSTVVPGLNVYFFGERRPLALRDLLFYWQD